MKKDSSYEGSRPGQGGGEDAEIQRGIQREGMSVHVRDEQFGFVLSVAVFAGSFVAKSSTCAIADAVDLQQKSVHYHNSHH